MINVIQRHRKVCIVVILVFLFTLFGNYSNVSALSPDYYGPGPIRDMERMNDGSIIGGRSTGHQIEVWRSINNGESFYMYTTVATNSNVDFGDIDFLVVPDSTTVFSAWREEYNGFYSVVIGRSDDNGYSWIYDSTIATSPVSYFIGAPCLIINEEGDLQCYYDSEQLAANNGYPGHQWVAMVGRNGITGAWSKYGLVVASRENNPALLSRDGLTTIVNLGNNTLMLFTEGGETSGAYSNVIREIRSYDGGRTWDYTNRRIVYQSPIDPLTGIRYNSYVPHALQMSDGTVVVTFCTDEDFPSPPDPSYTPVEYRRAHIKLIRSTNSDYTAWSTPITIWDNNPLCYLPGSIETSPGNLLVQTALLFNYNQMFSHYVYTGIGNMSYSNNRIYSGDLVGLLPNGQGVMSYPDGTYYAGAFSNGSWFGQGVFYWPAGPTLTGVMIGDYCGSGVLDYMDGNTYSGDFALLLPHGYGIKTYAFGAVYEGNWANGGWCGTGTVAWSNGHIFSGNTTSEGNGIGWFYDSGTGFTWNCYLIDWVPYPM